MNRIVSLFDKIYLIKEHEDGRNLQKGKHQQRVTLLTDKIKTKLLENQVQNQLDRNMVSTNP